MIVGLDFDNTIVNYDSIFHKAAYECGFIPSHLKASKLFVRDYLRSAGKETSWIELQGLVYGKRMNEAVAFDGVIDFIKQAKENNVKIVIISHKTQFPFLGPKYDLHESAKKWVRQYLKTEAGALISTSDTYFELTKDEKINRIKNMNCDYYIDDLPEILQMPNFPTHTIKILFGEDHEIKNKNNGDYLYFNTWNEIIKFFEKKWTNQNN